jgi:acyl carrier protein
VEITPHSRLDRDLGIDSLGRAGLILRIERGLQVQLPPGALAEAEHSGNGFATAGMGQRRSTSYSSQE